MAELIPLTPLAGRHAVSAAGCRLTVLELGPVAAIQPFPGGGADTALRARGLGFPAPGRSLEAEGVRIVWAGREMALLIGAPPGAVEGAAVIDVTDGWAGMALSGARGWEVLARLVPIDLRPAAFGEGTAARTLLNHVPALILRRGETLEILVPASYARTAWHEVAAAMELLAVRAG